MPLTPTFDSANSRVQIAVTSIPTAPPNLPVYLERQIPGSGWVAVRGAYPGYGVAGNLNASDYEFTPNVLNSYRARTVARYDGFSRVSASGWGNADSGQAYTIVGGLAADFAVGSGYGSQAQATVNVFRESVQSTISSDVDVTVDVAVSATTTVAEVYGGIGARRTDINNQYELQMVFLPTGVPVLYIAKRVGGVGTQLASFIATSGYAPGTFLRVRFRVQGTYLQAKVWAVSDPEPTSWQLTAVDSSLVTGATVSLWSWRHPSNTNVGLQVRFDNLLITDLSYTALNTILFSGSLTPVQNTVWLKFPLRPFLNLQVGLCNWSDETVPDRGKVFNVLGRRLPVAVTDLRLSRRFDAIIVAQDSEEAEQIRYSLSFGDVVFLQTPGPTVTCNLTSRLYPEQLYAYVETVTYSRPLDGVATMTVELPMIEVAPPDASLEAAGSTWGGIVAAFATWQIVVNTFPTWNDVLAYISNPGDEVLG